MLVNKGCSFGECIITFNLIFFAASDFEFMEINGVERLSFVAVILYAMRLWTLVQLRDLLLSGFVMQPHT